MSGLDRFIRGTAKEAADSAQKSAAKRAADRLRANSARAAAAAKQEPRRTPSTAVNPTEDLQVLESRGTKLDVNPVTGRPRQEVSVEVLAREVTDEQGNRILSEAGVEPTQLVRRRTGGDGNRSVAERVWITPAGDGQFQITSEGGTTLDAVVGEDVVRDMVQTGGWSRASGPAIELPDPLPSPLAVGRSLIEYSREPGNVANLARVVQELERLRGAGDGSLYEQALGIAGGGSDRLIDGQPDITPQNIQQGLELAENAGEAVAAAADSPPGNWMVGIGQADAPVVLPQDPRVLASRVAAAASGRPVLGSRLPTWDNSTQIQIGGGPTGIPALSADQILAGSPQVSDAQASETALASLGASRPAGVFSQDLRTGVSAEDPTAPSRQGRGALPGSAVFGDTGSEVRPGSYGPAPAEAPGSFSLSTDTPPPAGRASAFEARFSDQIPAPSVAVDASSSSRLPEGFRPTAEDRSSSVLDDLLAGAGNVPAGQMAFQINPGSWAEAMYGSTTPDELLALINRARGLEPYSFSTADSPVQSASELVSSLPLETRQVWGQYGMPRAGTRLPVPLPGEVRANAGATSATSTMDPGDVSLPRFLSDEDVAEAVSDPQPVPGERYIFNRHVSLSPQNIDDIEARIEQLNEVLSVLRTRARFEPQRVWPVPAGDGSVQINSTSESAEAADRVQGEIRRLQARLLSEANRYGEVDAAALGKQAEADEAERAAELAMRTRDANLVREANAAAGTQAAGPQEAPRTFWSMLGRRSPQPQADAQSLAPTPISMERLREIAGDVLNDGGRSDGQLPAAFGSYDSRSADGRPSSANFDEIRSRQRAIDEMTPSREAAASMSEAQLKSIAKRQAELQDELNRDVARAGGDPYEGSVAEGEVFNRAPAGKAQALMVEKLMSGSAEERLAALNDLFGQKVKGSYEIFKDPETGEVMQRGASDDAGDLVIKDKDTGEWRAFDSVRDAYRADEARPERFNPVAINVRATTGGFPVIDRLAAHPEIGSAENLIYNVLRQNASVTESMGDDALWATAQQLAADVARTAPSPVSPSNRAMVGTPGVMQRIRSAIQDLQFLKPQDFVRETTPVDRLVTMLPDADGLRAADPDTVRSELSQIRYVEGLAKQLEDEGYDVSPVRDAISKITPAFEESYRPPASMTRTDRVPEIELSRDEGELREQISQLQASIDQEVRSGSERAADRLRQSLALRRNQLESIQTASGEGGDDTALRGANEYPAPVLHSSERPEGFTSTGAFSMAPDVAESLRKAMSGELLEGATDKALGAPEIRVEEAPPRFDGQQSYPQAKIVVSRRYKGGVAPEREFLVDSVQPGVVYPDAVTLELGENNEPLFFVNREGALEMPAGTPAPDPDRTAARRMDRAREDQVLSLTSGGRSETYSVPPRPQQEDFVGEATATRTSEPAVAPTERIGPETGTRAEEPDTVNPASRPDGSAPRAPETDGRSQTVDEGPQQRVRASIVNAKNAKRLAALGGLGLAGYYFREPIGEFIGGDTAEAALVGGQVFGDAYQDGEDTNSSAERALGRVRRARTYGYHTSQNPLPR